MTPAPAGAQSLNPLVDVCTGVSIDQSTVRNLLEAANEPIVAPIETTFNALLGATIAIPGVTLIAPLDIDVTGIVGNAVAGNPVGVQVLDTNGNLVSPGSCNLTADGYALNTEGGIAIGGNAITGLGANGQQAVAGELDAIAFGNNAITAAGATGAIALGTGATVSAANSVALGAGSTNDRGAMTGYAALGIAGPIDSVGTVSIGAPGAERQLTNVAPGTALTDAATVGQVQGAITAAAADAVRYTDGTHTLVVLDGAGGTRITGVAPGTIAAGSTDAVNGGQLFETNQQVAANAGAIAGNAAAITTLQGQVGSNTTNIAAAVARIDGLDASVTAIDNRVSDNSTAITGIDARVTQNTNQLAAVQAQVDNVPVGYVSDADGRSPSAAPTDTAAFAGASGGTVRVTNVAAGELAAGSSDAVNGSQLAATNSQVAQNRADIVVLSATAGVGSAAPLQYSNAATPTTANGGTPTQDVTLVGANPGQPVRVHNVAAGTAATDAVNLGQLQSSMSLVQGQIAQSLADAAAYTDMRIAEIGFDLSKIRKGANSGTAAAMAMASIPQTMTVGESMIGGAVGHYRGQTAFGFGLSTTAGDRVVIKASGTIDNRGKGGVAAGAGIAF